MLRILHLSNLHLGRGGAVGTEEGAMAALLHYISRQRQAGTGPDLILVAGDLVFRGEAAAYSSVLGFFDRLRQAAGLPRKRLLCVPGNHDVDRACGRRLQRTLRSKEDAAIFFSDPEERALHARKFAAYTQFVESYFGEGGKNLRTQVFALSGLQVGVATFCSAWFSQDDDDQGVLWVGSDLLKEAAQTLQNTDLSIALLHHPISALHPLEQAEVRAALHGGFDLLCHGPFGLHHDEDEPQTLSDLTTQPYVQIDPETEVTGPSFAPMPQRTLELCAGPSYRDLRRQAQANLLTAEPGSLQITPLRLHPKEDRWQAETPRTYSLPLRERSQQTPRREAVRTAPGKAGAQRDEDLLRAYLQTVVSEADLARVGFFHPHKNEDERLLSEPLYVPLPALPLRGKVVSIHSLIGCQQRLVILGDPASGKTTTLRHVAAVLARHALLQATPSDQPSDPIDGFDFPRGLVPLPLPLSLSRLDRGDAGLQGTWPSDPVTVLETLVATRLLQGDPGFARRCLLRRGALLLLDASLPPSARRLTEAEWIKLAAGLRVLLERVPVTRIVCAVDPSQDPLALRHLQEIGFLPATLCPLRLEERTQIIDRFVQYTSAIPQGVTLQGQVAGLNLSVRQAALRQDTKALAEHPLLLQALCFAAASRGLPEQRAERFHVALEAILANPIRESPEQTLALVDHHLVKKSESLTAFRVAQTLSQRPDPWLMVRPLLSDPGSYESLRFLAGLLCHGRSEAAMRLLRALLSEASGQMDPGERAQLLSLLSQMLTEVAPYPVDPKLHKRAQEEYGRAVSALDDRLQSTPEPIRIAIAEGLGRAGDPRIALNLVEPPLPPGGSRLWVEIPKEDKGGLSAFSILRYPVTNAQMAHYASVSGYGGAKASRFAEEAQERPNHPAVCISHDDAMALCAFLSGNDWRHRYSLPRRSEWERALRQDSYDERCYPWGRTFEPTYVNLGRRQPGTTPVGVYPASTAALGSGCADLVGNVWEWCLPDEEEALPVEKTEPDPGRLCMGGSYATAVPSKPGILSARFPAAGGVEIGVRLVRRPK